MNSKQFVTGLCFGAVLGVLTTFSIFRAIEKPIYLQISGGATTDTASHKEIRLNNRVYLNGRIFLQGPVYLHSDNIDTSDLYKFVNKPVSVFGRIDKTSLENGDSILELNVRNITEVKDPKYFQ